MPLAPGPDTAPVDVKKMFFLGLIDPSHPVPHFDFYLRRCKGPGFRLDFNLNIGGTCVRDNSEPDQQEKAEGKANHTSF